MQSWIYDLSDREAVPCRLQVAQWSGGTNQRFRSRSVGIRAYLQPLHGDVCDAGWQDDLAKNA